MTYHDRNRVLVALLVFVVICGFATDDIVWWVAGVVVASFRLIDHYGHPPLR